MKKVINSCLLSMSVLLFAISVSAQQSNTGFLVIAPDRGFMGNQEVRDIHTTFSDEYLSSLAFITSEETDRFLNEGIEKLTENRVSEIVVIPLFLSGYHPLYKLAEERLTNARLTDLPLEITETMSQSYLTAEILVDRIAELSENPTEESLVVVATGASNQDEMDGITADVEKLLHMNHGFFDFNSETVIVFDDGGGRSEASQERLSEKLTSIQEEGQKPLVVTFDLTPKLDGMMAFGSWIRPLIRNHGALYNGNDITPHENVGLWLAKQANSYLPVTKENLGVIFMPHGSNYNWNRTMMDAIDELHEEYMIEHAFSMGDATLVDRAVEKLEARGATAITVLRIFSLESSFKISVEYTLGLRDQVGHGGMMHMMSGPPQRVVSSSEFYTTGGLEDSPLFAEALLDRAIGLSENPEDETIILVGHGTRTEEGNNRWMNNLETITAHMEKTADEMGYNFRDFKFENWREDWPDLRDKHINNVREMVKIASEDGGTAIVVPARTTKGGHAQRWLSDLDFKHDGEGFAPHPLFVEWVEGLIQESLNHFNADNDISSEMSEQSVENVGYHSH
ncbi:sirohydrochlorin chelatase [Rhodohalobacter sp. 8-1]|uniref:sirohydrochlorin chelatase n=1 Tax=Rhodohalobacter sp. 8-1 TaxID=3131972 RepID=UPI0030ED617F